MHKARRRAFVLSDGMRNLPAANLKQRPPELRSRQNFYAWQLWLHVRNGRAFRLFEMHSGTKEQCAETQICQWKNHVKIFTHVTVVQQMMAVEPEENSGAFEGTFSRQVHAPVHVFVGAVIRAARQHRAAKKSPLSQEKRC